MLYFRDGYLKSWENRWFADGLNSLHYTILETEDRKLYTWYLIGINKDYIMNETDKFMPGKIFHHKFNENLQKHLNQLFNFTGTMV